MLSLQTTNTWASGARCEPAALATFLQDADSYLVAHARAHQQVVVTHEAVAHSTKKIKTPNACLGVGVRYVTPFEMLRAERTCFVIDGRTGPPATGGGRGCDEACQPSHPSRALSSTAMNVGRRRCVSRNAARCAASSP